MTSGDLSRDELRSLLELLCDDALPPADMVRLDAALDTDAEARRLYREFFGLHALLLCNLRDESSRHTPYAVAELPKTANLGKWPALHVDAESNMPHDSARVGVNSTPADGMTQRVLRVRATTTPVLGFLGRTAAALNRPVVWSILAAGLLFAAYFVGISWDMLGKQLAPSSDSPTPPLAHSPLRSEPVATITDTADARGLAPFAVPGEQKVPVPFARGQAIAQHQPLAITAGLVELQLKQGVTLLIEGPADWSIDGQNNATLNRGKLVAKVPKQAIGFTLETPTAKIVDLGTEFGLDVRNDGKTDVQVLRGLVEVHSHGSTPTTLVTGDARRIEKGAIRPIQVKEGHFTTAVPVVKGIPLSLADILCGGDGTGSKTEAGIEPDTGRFSNDIRASAIFGDDKYHRAVDLPFVDGIFIPRGGNSPVQIDSAGHVFADFPRTSEHSHLNLWVRPDGVLYLHANKGVTLDLDAVRRHHGGSISRFTAKVRNFEPSLATEPAISLADAWVMVDGKVRFTAISLRGANGEQAIDIKIHETNHFLTLVATDAGNGISNDGIGFSDC